MLFGEVSLQVWILRKLSHTNHILGFCAKITWILPEDTWITFNTLLKSYNFKCEECKKMIQQIIDVIFHIWLVSRANCSHNHRLYIITNNHKNYINTSVPKWKFKRIFWLGGKKSVPCTYPLHPSVPCTILNPFPPWTTLNPSVPLTLTNWNFARSNTDNMWVWSRLHVGIA